MNISEYVAERNITVEIIRDKGIRIEDGFEQHAYDLKLRCGDREMQLPWGQGTGDRATPDQSPETVVDALLSDATGYENVESFEEWADEFCFDPDSRKAEKMYREVGDQTEKFIECIGGRDEFEHLAYNVERV